MGTYTCEREHSGQRSPVVRLDLDRNEVGSGGGSVTACNEAPPAKRGRLTGTTHLGERPFGEDDQQTSLHTQTASQLVVRLEPKQHQAGAPQHYLATSTITDDDELPPDFRHGSQRAVRGCSLWKCDCADVDAWCEAREGRGREIDGCVDLKLVQRLSKRVSTGWYHCVSSGT